jgi:hypothetical protein
MRGVRCTPSCARARSLQSLPAGNAASTGSRRLCLIASAADLATRTQVGHSAHTTPHQSPHVTAAGPCCYSTRTRSQERAHSQSSERGHPGNTRAPQRSPSVCLHTQQGSASLRTTDVCPPPLPRRLATVASGPDSRHALPHSHAACLHSPRPALITSSAVACLHTPTRING